MYFNNLIYEWLISKCKKEKRRKINKNYIFSEYFREKDLLSQRSKCSVAVEVNFYFNFWQRHKKTNDQRFQSLLVKQRSPARGPRAHVYSVIMCGAGRIRNPWSWSNGNTELLSMMYIYIKYIQSTKHNLSLK